MVQIKTNSNLKNKILDFIIKFEFPDFSLLGEQICVFWPQIRISCEKLYIGQMLVKIGQNPDKLIKKMKWFINLNLGLFIYVLFPLLSFWPPASVNKGPLWIRRAMA